MAKIKGPDGTIVDETDNPTALAYYGREPGYEIVGDEPPVVDAAETETPEAAETASRRRHGHHTEDDS